MRCTYALTLFQDRTLGMFFSLYVFWRKNMKKISTIYNIHWFNYLQLDNTTFVHCCHYFQVKLRNYYSANISVNKTLIEHQNIIIHLLSNVVKFEFSSCWSLTLLQFHILQSAVFVILFFRTKSSLVWRHFDYDVRHVLYIENDGIQTFILTFLHIMFW